MLASLRGAWDRKLGICLVIVAMLAGGLYYRDVSCQTRVNNTFRDNIVARSAVASAASAAEAALLSGVAEAFTQKPTTDSVEQKRRSEKFRKLFVDYQLAAANVERVRAENPYPDLNASC